ncbi:hypothetical protein JW872_02150 [Candidatus Babeliales bacterium]|nr:hypothetical protein [Candidatus Babeliales bacterium]
MKCQAIIFVASIGIYSQLNAITAERPETARPEELEQRQQELEEQQKLNEQNRTDAQSEYERLEAEYNARLEEYQQAEVRLKETAQDTPEYDQARQEYDTASRAVDDVAFEFLDAAAQREQYAVTGRDLQQQLDATRTNLDLAQQPPKVQEELNQLPSIEAKIQEFDDALQEEAQRESRFDRFLNELKDTIKAYFDAVTSYWSSSKSAQLDYLSAQIERLENNIRVEQDRIERMEVNPEEESFLSSDLAPKTLEELQSDLESYQAQKTQLEAEKTTLNDLIAFARERIQNIHNFARNLNQLEGLVGRFKQYTKETWNTELVTQTNNSLTTLLIDRNPEKSSTMEEHLLLRYETELGEGRAREGFKILSDAYNDLENVEGGPDAKAALTTQYRLPESLTSETCAQLSQAQLVALGEKLPQAAGQQPIAEVRNAANLVGNRFSLELYKIFIEDGDVEIYRLSPKQLETVQQLLSTINDLRASTLE